MPAARPHRTLRSIAIQLTMAFCALCPSLADAQVSCADWNTAKFFKEAKAQDITHCVAAGSDPNVRADSGYTPLHSAAANSTEPAVVARLLDAGADPEARGETGLTPLHVAAGGSAVPAVVTALVNAGADLGARNDAGYTPLHAAAGSAVPEMVTVLVNAGADLEARTESGLTPLHVAAGGSAVPAVVTALVNAGADLEARTESGLTPLHVAARSSVVPAVVSALADAGADLEAGTESGFTPLHVAAGISKTPAVVTALVNAGADLEARTESGLTPLHVAAAGSAVPAVVSALVNAGADPNARDQANKTAGDYAQFNDALKDTEAYGQLKDAITIIGLDMVETWMELGSMIVWGIAVLAGLLLWGLYSSRVGRRMRYAGSAATIMLTGILSLLVPAWAVALSGKKPMDASLAEMMVASIEAGITATWITIGVVGSMYLLLFRKIPNRRTRIAGGIAMSLVVVIVSYYASDWLFLFG